MGVDAVEICKAGGVIAYPTEAVFGLGCDPDNQSAVEKLLKIKSRSVDKGLILLAGTFEQLTPYIDCSSFSKQQMEAMLNRWPNGISQIVPAGPKTKKFISGRFNTVAVRLTTQPDVMQICQQLNKPIVSTSANLSGQVPARIWQQIVPPLSNQIDYLVQGETLGYKQPSKIIDAKTGEIIRT